MAVTKESGTKWKLPSDDTTVLFLPPQEDTRSQGEAVFGVAANNGMVTHLVTVGHFEETIGDHLPHAQVGNDMLYLFPVGGINDDVVKAVPVASVVEAMRQGPQTIQLEHLDDIKQLGTRSDSDMVAETIAGLLPKGILASLDTLRRRRPPGRHQQ